ncbi:DNA replication ATP-dependent helicase/nuclease DNA2 [Arapaima gigas]
MGKEKLRRSAVIGSNQKHITSFFGGAMDVASAQKKSGSSRMKSKLTHIKSMMSDLDEDVEKERENFPSSPCQFVPETPSSQIQPSCQVMETKEGVHSPVTFNSHSGELDHKRYLAARRPSLFPVLEKNPLREVPSARYSGADRSGSTKRLPLCRLEETPNTKLRKTFSLSSRHNTATDSILNDEDLDICMEMIEDSAGAQVKRKSSICGQGADWKRRQVLIGDTRRSTVGQRKAVPALTTVQFSRKSSNILFSKLFSCDGTLSSNTEQEDRVGVQSHSDLSSADGPTIIESPVDLCVFDGRVSDTGSSEVENLYGPYVNEDTLKDTQPSSNGEGNVSQDALTCSESDLMSDAAFWLDEKMELNCMEITKAVTEKQTRIPEDVILCTGLYNRYWVLDVQEAIGSRGTLEKHLKITASKTTQQTETCILKDGWESTPVAVGNIIHLEGECISGTWMIDRERGFLVLFPDILISSTSIASSIRCMRRGVLGERFKAFEGSSKQMLNGTIVHEIFQKAAMSGDFALEKLRQLTDKVLLGPSYLKEMYSLKLTQEDMRQQVEEYLPPVSEWADDYLHSSPLGGKKQLMLKLLSKSQKQEATCNVAVTDFVDIEENIWSPRFGLKGKIDLTTRVRIHRRGRSWEERVVPLELKTGKESNSIEHRSQVILYNLMSLERRSDAEVGFLLYLKTGNMHPIVSSHMDKRELLKLRNTLVHYLSNSLRRGDSEPKTSNEPQPSFLEEETQHLREAHLHYFSHWVWLCTLETALTESKGGRQSIWLQTTQEKETQGGCIGNLLRTGDVTAMSDNKYAHFFRRQGPELVGASLNVGDKVLVSGQDLKLFAVAKGYVTEVSNHGVACQLDRSLSKLPRDVLFRLDQDEGERELYIHLGNLSKLMENSLESERLRELIVEFRPPRFIPSLSSVLPQDAKDTVANILKGLNKPQKQAMKKVLLSKDYTLIVGMPGTGKTTTICSLVRILHACGFSVLLTSYTHSAVDNILLKLRRFKVGFLRLGHAHKVHPDIRPFTEEETCTRSIRTQPELEQLYNRELVVATTCMGVRHPIFSRRRFDFCIVDEASQISQPVCLGPLFYAERFVLVGDHQQLAPIVKNPHARALGMDESLFKRLEHHSDAVVQLNVQYRMNSKIMSLSNMLMYGGKLECGSDRTANAVLELPGRSTLLQELELCVSQAEYLAWVQAILEPQKPICFLDTAKVPAPELVAKGGISNPTEAILVHCTVRLLLKAGCRASDIGIIAPYRQQLSSISSLLGDSAFSAVEVNTVDKYQGRDKSVVIVSFVRSHAEGHVGELLKDWRRLNVAVTRAKHKLIMLGCSLTLCHYTPLKKLLSHMEEEAMISFHLQGACDSGNDTLKFLFQ